MSNCHCINKHGHTKRLYTTKRQVEDQREYQSKENNIKLRVYSCPNIKHGWHLTSNNESQTNGYARAEEQLIISQYANRKPSSNKIRGVEMLKKKIKTNPQ